MSWPLYDGGFWPALVLGLFFGLALEGAGFGSARKLTAQFTLHDFTVVKVMMTAVVIASLGLWLVESAGAMEPGRIYIPTLYAWSVPLGGALIGAGFALGGYCPGTSAVGLASGRWDALVFIIGMITGVAVFAAGFDAIESFYRAAPGPSGQTLDALLGIPRIVVIAALALACAAIFVIGGKVEKRLGGPLRSDTPSGD